MNSTPPLAGTADAIVLREPGTPEVLRVESVEIPPPPPGYVRVRQSFIGVNFHDCYVRSGLYRTLQLPGIPGIEAAGVIEYVSEDVVDLKPGDRVAYVDQDYGAYTSVRNVRAERLIKLPDDLSERTAASLLVRGLTTVLLLTRFRPLQAGDWCLIQAAAGGVGQLLTRAAHQIGARIIGTAGSEDKAAIALRNGCEHVILYKTENVSKQISALTGGRGVDVVYDSVGKDTFEGSLESLAIGGHLIEFGQSSGAVPPFAISRLAGRSNSISRPILFHFIDKSSERDRLAQSLFQLLRTGAVSVDIAGEYALKDARDAHRALEGRLTAGALVLNTAC